MGEPVFILDWLKGNVGEAGDDEGELEGGLPFPEPISGDHDSLLDGDLA